MKSALRKKDTSPKSAREILQNEDRRLKYNHELRFRVVSIYLEGMEIRSIERLENQTVA